MTAKCSKTHRIKLVLCGAVFLLTVAFSDAQIITNTWTWAGGGLAPATYTTNNVTNYRPTTLLSDQGGTTSTVNVTWPTSQGFYGIGSSGYPDGYEGIYSSPSGLALTLTNNQPLAGLDRIDFTFLSGGQFLSYTGTSLTLSYNTGNTSVASSVFNAGTPVSVETPIGTQTLTPYAWSWTNLSSLGPSDSFSISWNANAPAQHAFLTDITVVQAVPEPSVYALLTVSATAMFFWLRRKRTS